MSNGSYDTHPGEHENMRNRFDLVLHKFSNSEKDIELDPAIKNVQIDLLKSVSMRLWLMNLLCQGGFIEEQFTKMFDQYEDQTKRLMDRRNKMLDHAQNIDPLVKGLKKAKVYLAELKMKNEIGIVSDEEYAVKEPALKWDIGYYEDEISKRKAEEAFLVDPTRVISMEDFSRMKRIADDYRSAVDGLKNSSNFGSETITIVKTSLDEMLGYLDKFDIIGDTIPGSPKPEIPDWEPEETVSPDTDAQDSEDKLFKHEKELRTGKEESKLIRIQCPYKYSKGKKCNVIAFGLNEDNAYEKLEIHIARHHPEELIEFKETYARRA